MTPLLMSVPQAAEYLGRSAWWVRRRIYEGEIPTRLLGRRYFLSRPDLDRWLNGETFEVAAPSLGAPSPKGARRVG